MTTIRFFILTVLLLFVTACGATTHTTTIRTDGMRFREDEVRVRAGEAVMLRIINRDGYAHAFDLDAFDIHTPLAANETREFSITPQQPGRYDFYCGAPGHQMAGMVGVLIVEP